MHSNKSKVLCDIFPSGHIVEYQKQGPGSLLVVVCGTVDDGRVYEG